MKNPRYYPSLYVIVPLIFGGLAIIVALVAHRLYRFYPPDGGQLHWSFIGWIVLMASLAALCGLVIVILFLRPADGLLTKIRGFPISVWHPLFSDPTKTRLKNLEQYNLVFDQVSSILARVDISHVFPEVVGESRAWRGVLGQVLQLAPTEAPVLLLGETGTGKELIATCFHEHSQRQSRPLVKIDGAALAENSWEREFFGDQSAVRPHEKSHESSSLERAEGGTLFISEISLMPLATQAKFLLTFREKHFLKTNYPQAIKINFRLIASSSRNLEELVNSGQFLRELYELLFASVIRLPPLRDRVEDVPLLVNHYLRRGPRTIKVSPSALSYLMCYTWPGNVEELFQILESALTRSDQKEVLEPEHLPSPPVMTPDEERPGHHGYIWDAPSPTYNLDFFVNDIEKNIIVEALRRSGGVQVRAAGLLGINERSLWHRIKKYAIDIRSVKSSKI